MIDEKERAARLVLNEVFGFEPKTGNTIIRELGSALALLQMSSHDRLMLLGAKSSFVAALSVRTIDTALRQLETLEEGRAAFITQDDAEYPQLLKDSEDPPVGLYVRGSIDIEETLRQHVPVSIVGTRDVSPYGVQCCNEMVDAFSRSAVRPVIVSGFAMGVDITAHKRALERGLPTIAVLPTGIDAVYPRQHARYASMLENTPSCSLITDYPPQTAPKAINFLRRNRIIAALSRSTILVESKARGGGLMTARLASSYGRDVYAVPGRLDDLRSRGCLDLLADKVAEPVTDYARLVRDIGLGEMAAGRTGDFADTIKKMYVGKDVGVRTEVLVSAACLVKKERGIAIDEIARRLMLDYPEALQALYRLESDNLISIDILQRCTLR